jgi:hypothetical protein
MKSLINLFFLSLFCISSLFSQEENGLLWEISGNGLSKPSYLYGTIHVICPNDFLMSEMTKKAFEKTERVYLELDYDDPDFMRKIQRNLSINDGTTIKDYLSKEDYTLLDSYLKTNLGTSAEAFGFMKPLGFQSITYIALLKCQPKSYEEEFSIMAKNAKKEILGLETVEEQMGFFDKIPVKKQMDALMETVKNDTKAKKELKEMINAYVKSDLNLLTKILMTSDWGNFKGYEDDLLFNRNNAWTKQMVKLMTEKSTFFAVGAGHLDTDKGLIALLRRIGYNVKAVKE